jgi:AcrR family transcriptional regulator
LSSSPYALYNENMEAASKRPYRKRKRAESEEETRRRITEAAVELHGTVGPANTTVTEVAELAGVSRMTVYNHFPTDADLFVACSTHWGSEHPFPDPAAWTAVADPGARLGRALADLYAWYGAEREMLANVLRDAPLIPSLAPLVDGWWSGYMDEVLDVLAVGWTIDGGTEQELRASLRVVLDFHTWQILGGSGLDDEAAAELATRAVSGVVTPFR